MKTVLIVTAVAAALSLQACSRAEEKTAAPATAPAPAAPVAEPTPIVVTGAAITIGRTIFPIGAPRDLVLAAATEAGGAPKSTGPFAECGAGPMDHADWSNGLQLLFQDEKLAGWQTQTPAISTDKGIHVGSTLAELKAAYPTALIEDSTIGWTFASGELMGLLGEDKTAVQRINVGVTCDFT
ncbi:hypothetical protein [Brevundimonas goettingensis]|uniref:Uncharacterized protein n=1 Tax=Brevundimonas goettingensis TaxID=2774190 RepID=A0A975C3J2_9CAUL|nr:hypothetical protein [Brevundimonas goettingensis]QTC91804.1 hypothetical protein IFJ75_02405 [Brevundimonas goettingensis]